MRPFHRHTMITVLSTLMAGTAAAATPAVTGLGQAWPNAADISASPHFHVYAFQKQGVRFLQINDTNGTVRGAIAYADGQMLELPLGQDAEHWLVTDDAATPASGETVYHDDAMTVRAAPMRDGAIQLMVLSECKGDPAECSVKGP